MRKYIFSNASSFIFASKEEVNSVIEFLCGLLISPKYKNLNIANNVPLERIKDRIIWAKHRLKDINEQKISFNKSTISPDAIHEAWYKFDKIFTGQIDERIKNRYRNLINLTCDYLGYIRTVPLPHDKVEYNPTVRTIDINDEETKLVQLNKKRNAIKEEINKINKSTAPDKNRINDLYMQLKLLDANYKEIMQTIEKVKDDNNAEQIISKRIDGAFNELKTYTLTIEKEQEKAKKEYWTFFIALSILLILFLYLYIRFIFAISNKDIVIKTWQDYLPYGITIPVFVALIWLCTYLKNRADKISIELSMRLFNIHYLEGLLQMTNKLSHNQAEAMGNINKTVTTMLQDYQHKIYNNQDIIKDISKYEDKELDFNPYWKFLKEIKDLINAIKK